MLDRDKETVPLLESDVLEDGRRDDTAIEIPEVELSHGKLMENDKFLTLESTKISLLERLKLMRLVVLVAALVLIIGLTSSKVLEKRETNGAGGISGAGSADGVRGKGGGLGGVIGEVTGRLGEAVGGLTGTVGGLAGGLGGVIGEMSEGLGGAVGGLTGTVGGLAGSISNTLTDAFKYGGELLKTLADIMQFMLSCGNPAECGDNYCDLMFVCDAFKYGGDIVAPKNPGITIPTITTTTMATTTAMTTTTAPSSCTAPSRQIIYSDYKNASNVSYNYLTPCKNGSTTCIGMLRKQCYQETSDRACPNSLLCLNSTINVITVFDSPADKCPGAGDETLHVYPLGVTSKGDNAEGIDCSCYSVINAVAFNFYVNNAATPPQYKIAKNTATPQPAAPFVFTFAFCAQAFA